MSFAAVGIGLGVASLGTGIASSVMGADAASDAAKKNRDAQQYAADKNYQQFQESRGSGGSAVLPLYLKTSSGRLFEDTLGKDAIAAYEASRKDPATALADNQARVNAFLPSISGTRSTTNDIFNGGVERQMLDNLAPVAAARVKFKRGAAIDALNKTLGEINAMQTGRGYGGDSMGSAMLRFNARKAAGDAVADANLQNAVDERTVRDSALNLKLNSLNLPYAVAKQDMGLFNLPTDTYVEQLLQQQQPFKFFYIGPGNAPQVQPLTYTATPGAGQLALQGISQAGGTALNYYLQQQQQQQYLNAMKSLMTPTAAPVFSAPAAQDMGWLNSSAGQGITIPG